MKRRTIAMFLVLMFMVSFTSVAAYTQQEKTADALNELELLLGTGNGYQLEKKLSRVEGITLLVRMIGKDAEASAWTQPIPFTDVPLWATGYVGYAQANGITNGISATAFWPGGELSDYMFLTLVLRALGYSDQGEAPLFVWNDPYALAKKVGLIEKAEADADFTRGDAIEIFWRAMEIKLVGKNVTLAQSLIDQEIFTSKEYKKAQDIQKNGRKENAGQPAPEPEDSNDNSSSGNTNTGSNTGSGSTNTGSGNTNTGSGNTSTGSGSVSGDDGKMTYEKYNAMSGEDQQKYFSSYANPMDFFNWYNEAKAEYEASQNRIEIGEGGSIDLGDLINGNP